MGCLVSSSLQRLLRPYRKPVHLLFYSKVHVNITLPSNPESSKRSLPSRYPNPYFVCISCFLNSFCVFQNSYLPRIVNISITCHFTYLRKKYSFQHFVSKLPHHCSSFRVRNQVLHPHNKTGVSNWHCDNNTWGSKTTNTKTSHRTWSWASFSTTDPQNYPSCQYHLPIFFSVYQLAAFQQVPAQKFCMHFVSHPNIMLSLLWPRIFQCPNSTRSPV